MRAYLESSVGRKLTFAVSVALALLGAIVAFLLLRVTRTGLEDLARADLQLFSDTVAASLASAGPDGHAQNFRFFATHVESHHQVALVQVLDTDGIILWSTNPENEGADAIPRVLELLQSEPTRATDWQEEGGNVTLVRPLPNDETCHSCHEASVSQLGYLQVQFSGKAVATAVLKLQWLLWFLAVLPILVTALLLTELVRRIVARPLERLAATMARAESGDFLVRARVSSRDEFGRLAEAFNRMLARITELGAARLDVERELEAMEHELEEKEELEEKSQVIEQTNRELEARLQELSILFDFSSLTARRRSLQELFDTLTEIVGVRLGYDEFAILLLDEAKGTLTVRSTYGMSKEETEEIEGMTFEVGQGVSGETARTGRAILIDDTRKDPRFLHYKGARMADGAFLSLPLQYGQRIIGVMNFLRPALVGFSKEEMRFLQAIADQAAVAIDNVQLYQRLTALSATDELTGLANRRVFTERITHEIKRANRFDRELALLMIDIDNFKHYNDTNGHVDGDALLKRFANVLRSSVREVDHVARYGGEEFVVILPNADRREALAVAEKIRRRVENTRFRHGRSQPDGKLTISIGVAVFPADAADGEELLLRADFALYDAKEAGRNRVSVFDSRLQKQLERARS